MDDIVVNDILNWTEENINTGASIESLAREIGYSRKTLEIRFRQYCGFSPGEYLIRRRMSRAAVLLRMTVWPVTDIATLFHYHSSQNFARAFRTFTGVTPTQYREQSTWAFQALQLPLLMGRVEYKSHGVCVLPALKLYGSVMFCQVNFLSFLSDDILTSKMINALLPHKGNNDSEICIASRVMPSSSLSSARSAVVNVEMIFQGLDEEVSSEVVVVPAGNYMQFSFRGSWKEYVFFTRLIYFKLAEEGKFRRNGFDISYFTFPSGDNKEVNCRHLIPVE